MIHVIPPFIGYCFTPIRIKVYEGLGPTSHLYKTHAIFKNHQYVHWFKSLKIFNLSIQNANKYEFLQFLMKKKDFEIENCALGLASLAISTYFLSNVLVVYIVSVWFYVFMCMEDKPWENITRLNHSQFRHSANEYDNVEDFHDPLANKCLPTWKLFMWVNQC